MSGQGISHRASSIWQRWCAPKKAIKFHSIGHSGDTGSAHVVTVVGRGNNINGSAATIGLTTTLNRRNQGALVISFSPRNGDADNFKVRGRSLSRYVCSTLLGSIPTRSLILSAGYGGIFIVPTAVRLTNTRVRLIDTVTHRAHLGSLLRPVRSRFSFVFVSYPPSLKLLAVGTLATTSDILVPVRYRCCTLRNMAGLLRSVGVIGSHLGGNLSACNILVAVCSSHASLSGRIIRRIRSCFNSGTFGALVPHAIGVSRTPSFNRPMVACTPRGGNTGTCVGLTGRIVGHT